MANKRLKKKQVSIYIEPETWEQLYEIKEQDGIALAEFIRRAIQSRIDERNKSLQNRTESK